MSELIDKCTECPECGCSEYIVAVELNNDCRICIQCKQEWFKDINYKKYSSPIYYEVWIRGCRSLPPKDKNGDPNDFDKRSVKRRIRKLLMSNPYPVSVTSFMTKLGGNRKMIYSNWPANPINLIGV